MERHYSRNGKALLARAEALPAAGDSGRSPLDLLPVRDRLSPLLKCGRRYLLNSWEQFDFLIGEWSSPMSGQPGEAVSGASTFSFELDRNILIRKSYAQFAPEPGAQEGLVHRDLLVIYRQSVAPEFRAIYFDNEGHVLHYNVSIPDEQPGIIFESEGSNAGPRARLVYRSLPDGTLTVEFFVAPPGGDLISHVKGVLRRKI